MGALKLLLDAHAFYWWYIDSPKLSPRSRGAIADNQNQKFVSAISAWEFITKFCTNKQPEFAGIAADVAGAVAAQGFTELAITMQHAEVAANLPFHHRDPMDRLLIGQAMVEDMTIITADAQFPPYGVKILW